jgi:uncharacterized protein YqcC (DUF446 family)
MPCSHKEVETLIIKLEQSLRDAMLWSSSAPSVEALQSKLPFAIDSMSFEQWLQFVFIPKMTDIVNLETLMPQSIELLPMAEQSLGTADNHSEYMKVIKQIDLIFALS